ncbi:MAG: Membrane alanyl aminopeptidase [Frankiales bacterium]|nr:Membrane alanyl aminopeptidase [Frankiales bacterium]
MRNLLREEAAARAGLLDVSSYDVDLDLTAAADFGSTSVIRFACRRPGAASFVELDGTPVEVVLNGRTLAPEADEARIHLPDLQADNVLRVVARCAWSRTGEGLHRFTDPADQRVYVWGQSFLDDAQRMFACFDQPDLKATFRVAVTAPADWTVIGNERGQRDGGRWTFRETARMSPYLFTVAAGPWYGEQRVHDGIELGVWCRQSLAPHLEAEELFEITAQCFDSYHQTFRIRYPFGDTYDQLWVPEFNHGAMENAGAVTFAENLLFRSRVTEAERRERAMVIAHEMAHMWFGNLVTMRWWDDLWLNESFAELMGFHTTDVATRYDGGWTAFCTGRKAWGYSADQMPTTHPISGPVTDNRSALLNFDGISYAKGASALRQLMVLVGQDEFFEGVRRYLGRHAFGNTTLRDFLAAIEEASGRDLTHWAETWLRTAGVSTLRADGDAVRQEAPSAYPVLRPHRIGIGRYDRAGGALVARDRLDVEIDGPLTPVASLAGPADLLLLNDGDWTFAKIRFDERSLATLVGHLRELGDPLSRALCWAGLWDATRDAELSARAFVAAVLDGAAGESDPEVLTTLLSQARTAAALWLDDAELLAALAARCAGQMHEAAGGTDLQLSWTKEWVAATRDVGPLSDLLQGRAVPPGLRVDTELRWHVVRRLSVLGAASEDDIAAELARDSTAAGERHADYARAARPHEAAKRDAWEQVTTDLALSNHQSQAMAGGFWQVEQAELCRPYIDRYFDEIRAVWDARSPQVAGSLARELFPRVAVEQDVLDRTAAFLSGDLPPGLRRVVLERGDDLRRAVAARALG